MTLRHMSQDLLGQAGLIHIYIVFSSMSFIWEQKDQLRLQEDKMRELTDALNKQVEENRYNNYDTQLTKSTCQVFKELILELPLLIPFKLCTHCVLCPDVSSVLLQCMHSKVIMFWRLVLIYKLQDTLLLAATVSSMCCCKWKNNTILCIF